mmetsp:Transcript_30028/g.86146  ORF Transcript_30028/g.86146 Transcript_30028/m.86146 type:complete len:292 (+) Transcript_30028:56-931(+)
MARATTFLLLAALLGAAHATSLHPDTRTKRRRAKLERKVRDLFCSREDPCYRRGSLMQADPRQNETHAVCFDGAGASRPAKLTMVTLAANLPGDYNTLLRHNRIKEADKFGYEYCEYTHALEDKRDIAWSKVVAIRVLLEHGRKQVAWMDADALIVNPTPFEEITGPHFSPSAGARKDLVLTDDFTQDSPINSGVLVTRSTPWSVYFWKSIWEDFPEAISHSWWEQEAIILFRARRSEDFSKHVAIVPHRLMNSHAGDDAGPNSFVVHAAGGHQNGKYENLARDFGYLRDA